MRIVSILACLFATMFHGTAASANVLEQIPIERQFVQADMVIIGRVGTRQHCLIENVRMVCAEIISEVLLKGTPAQEGLRRLLVLGSNYTEFGIETMELSGTLLIFMRLYREEMYLPIVGRNSVFLIERAR